LILATYILGKHFGIKTLYVTLMVPLFLRFIPLIHITDSILIASIVGGLLVGASISLALSSKCATGGTDVIALLIKKFVPKLELASILFVLDMIIVLLSMIISRTYITSMYSVVALLTIMMTIKLSKKVLSYE
jgi:uncharacterized membrane-anchored protein YitT (DUF2179 family)